MRIGRATRGTAVWLPLVCALASLLACGSQRGCGSEPPRDEAGRAQPSGPAGRPDPGLAGRPERGPEPTPGPGSATAEPERVGESRARVGRAPASESAGPGDEGVNWESLFDADEPLGIGDLRAALLDERSGVASEAVEALEDRGDRAAVRTLAEVLEGPASPELKIEAIEALAATGDPEAAWALREALWEQPPEVASAAIAALEDLGGSAAAAILAEYVAQPGPSDLKLRAVEALVWIDDPEAARALGGTLLGDPVDVAQAAVEALGDLGGPHAPDALARVFARPGSSELKLEAISVLGDLDGPHAAQVAALGLRDPDPDVRQEAAEALFYIGDPVVVSTLWGAWRSERDPVVREAILDTLEGLDQDVDAYRED